MESISCHKYYECDTSSTLLKDSSTSYTQYRLGEVTASTSLDFEMTTDNNFAENKAIVDISNDQNVKSNEKSPDSRAFGVGILTLSFLLIFRSLSLSLSLSL